MTTLNAPVLREGQNGSTHLNKAFASLRVVPGPFTVAALTTATAAALKGQIVFVSNGAAGQPCLAYSDGTTFHQVALGAAIADH